MTKADIIKYVVKTPHNTNPNMIGNMLDILMKTAPEPRPVEPTVTYETVEVDFALRNESVVESFNNVSCTVATLNDDNSITIGPDNVQIYKDLMHHSNIIAGTPIIVTVPSEQYDLEF